MNRGINRDDIFAERKSKKIFLDVMERTARNFKIKILAYCIRINGTHE